MMQRLIGLTVLSFLVSSVPGFAETTAQRWHDELATNQTRLQAEAWDEAYGVARRIVSEMIADLKGGPDGVAMLAVAYAQRAIAEAGLDRRDEAVWTFAIAQNLNSDFRSAPLEAFGAAGAWLDDNRLAAAHTGVIDLDRDDLLPPLVIDAPAMVFLAAPEILEAFDLTMTVEVVIDTSGRPREPIVRGSLDNPAPVALSLENLRLWRFQPASVAGENVPTRIPVDLPLTQGAADGVRSGLAELYEQRIGGDSNR